MRPLHMLAFLLPLVVAYEAGSVLYLTDRTAGVQQSVEAYRLFGDFFHAFGVVGLFLPGIALTTVLICWHMLIRDRWFVDPKTLGGMLLESIAWTMPLLVLAAITDQSRATFGLVVPRLEPLASANDTLRDMPVMARMVISVGAGLYEEMLFRLVGIALLHFILVDLIQVPSRWGTALAVVLAALAFALYHRPVLPEEWHKLLFFTLSGIYLGTIYTMRGFGVVVGAHAVYDILVLVVFPSLAPGQTSP